MSNADSAAYEAQVGHLLHHGIQALPFAPAFMELLQCAHVAGLSHDADPQDTHSLGNQRVHAAVLGQIFHTLQHKQQMGTVHIVPDFPLDGIKIQPFLNQLPEPEGDQLHLRPGGKAVQAADPAAGMLFHVDFGSLNRGIMGAGKITGDGNGKNTLGIAKGFQPLAHIGARGTGFPLIGRKLANHLRYIQRSIVHIFPLVVHNFQGNHPKRNSLQRKHIGGGIHHNPDIHTITS